MACTERNTIPAKENGNVIRRLKTTYTRKNAQTCEQVVKKFVLKLLASCVRTVRSKFLEQVWNKLLAIICNKLDVTVRLQSCPNKTVNFVVCIRVVGTC